MDFNDALNTLDAVKNCGTKRKEKEDLLNKARLNPILEKCFVYTYDWMQTYGITTPDFKDLGNDEEIARDEIWKRFISILGFLSTRELTGGAAKLVWADFISKECNQKEAYWLTKILNRDLKIGVAESTVAKIWPGSLSLFDCQLATELNKVKPKKVKKGQKPEPLFTFPLWVEPKLDGLRVLILVNGQVATAHSRTGKELPGLQHFANGFAKSFPGRYVIDGEIFHKKWNSTISLTKTYPENLSASEREQLKELIYYTFDALPLEDFKVGFCSLPLTDRRKELEHIVSKVTADNPELVIEPTHIDIVNSQEEIDPIYVKALESGVEGVMVKDPTAPYKFGRGTNWLKAKPWSTIDAPIVGFYPGEDGTKHENRLGGFVVELDNGKSVRVGGGLSDKQRDEFWLKQEELMGRMIEFKAQMDADAVAVARFPVFVRFRPDRD